MTVLFRLPTLSQRLCQSLARPLLFGETETPCCCEFVLTT